MSVVVVILVVAAAVAAAGVAAVGVAGRAARRRDQVVPGHDIPGPAGWARGHTPAARLHRRLRAAMAALRALPDLGGSATTNLRADLDRYALTLDRMLVAVSNLPGGEAAPALGRLTADVEAIERATGALAERAAAGLPAGADVVRSLEEQVAHLEAARAELDALESGGDAPGDV